MHIRDCLRETARIALAIDSIVIEAMATELARVRSDSRKVYIVGIGGSLANAIHMAADLRRLCNVDAMAPSNQAEMSAAANDDGWEHIFDGFLSRIEKTDCLFVLSVGGGTETVSKAISSAVKKAKGSGASVLGIVGPNGGVTAELGNVVLQIPCGGSAVTPHTEAFQAVVWHALVSHPLLQKKATKW